MNIMSLKEIFDEYDEDGDINITSVCLRTRETQIHITPLSFDASSVLLQDYFDDVSFVHLWIHKYLLATDLYL